MLASLLTAKVTCSVAYFSRDVSTLTKVEAIIYLELASDLEADFAIPRLQEAARKISDSPNGTLTDFHIRKSPIQGRVRTQVDIDVSPGKSPTEAVTAFVNRLTQEAGYSVIVENSPTSEEDKLPTIRRRSTQLAFA